MTRLTPLGVRFTVGRLLNKRVVTLVAAFITIAPASQALAEAEWNHPLPKWVYLDLARCETQNNTKHRTRSYVGAFGFYRRTWDLFADTPNSQAHTLTFAQQARVLDRAFFFGHTENGRKQWAVGAYGHGCWKYYWKQSAELRTLVCNNGKVQVRKQCRK